MKRKESNVIMLSHFGWFMFGTICGYVLACLMAAGGDDDE